MASSPSSSTVAFRAVASTSSSVVVQCVDEVVKSAVGDVVGAGDGQEQDSLRWTDRGVCEPALSYVRGGGRKRGSGDVEVVVSGGEVGA
jgi:hypothetical protein